jgi:hypothetical protein
MDLQEADRLARKYAALGEPLDALADALAVLSKRGWQLTQHLRRAPVSGLRDSFWREAEDRCKNLLKFLADVEAEIPAARAALEAVTGVQEAK